MIQKRFGAYKFFLIFFKIIQIVLFLTKCKKMKTISKIVEETLAQKNFLQEAIADGIINYSALARILIPEIENKINKEVTIASVVVALKRLAPFYKISIFDRLDKMLKNLGEMIVRTNLEESTYSNSKTLMEIQAKIWEKLQLKDEFFTFSRGVFETSFVYSHVLAAELNKMFVNELLKKHELHLASITIKLPKGNTTQPGLYYSILKNIAWEGISIYEVISTTNEFTVIIKETDLDKAMSVFAKLKVG
jgi:hypothetical protein